MRRYLHQPYSLKAILLLCFISIAVLPAVFISSYFYRTVSAHLEKSAVSQSRLMLESTADKLDTRIDQINEFSNWLCKDPVIANILTNPSDGLYTADIQQTIQNIKKQFTYRPITEYILSLLIVGENTDIRHGPEASLVDAKLLNQLQLSEKDEDGLIYWGACVQNLTALTEYPEIIPYRRQITDAYGTVLGELILLLNPAVFADECTGLHIVDGAAYTILQKKWRDHPAE